MSNSVANLKCTDCDFFTNDPICFLDHKLIIHEGIFMDDQYICDFCDQGFRTADLLDQHVDQEHPANDNENGSQNEINEDEEVDDEDDYEINNKKKSNYKSLHKSLPLRVMFRQMNICFSDSGKTNKKIKYIFNYEKAFDIPKYKIKCVLCNQHFDTPFYLGEHYITNHPSYEDQLFLDDSHQSSFPGFQLLELLEVIKFPSRKEMIQLIDKLCGICCKHYAIYNYKNNNNIFTRITSDDLDNFYDTNVFNDGYVSDTEIDVINKKENMIIKRDEIKDLSYPLIMRCCDGNICHECLKTHLTESKLGGLIKCPFCMKDHTRHDLDYIKIYENGDCDKKLWEEWWKKNDRVDKLAF